MPYSNRGKDRPVPKQSKTEFNNVTVVMSPEKVDSIVFSSVQKVETDYENTVPVLDNQVCQDSNFEPDASSDLNGSRESTGMEYEDSTSQGVGPQYTSFHDGKDPPLAEHSQATVSNDTTGAPEEIDSLVFASARRVETVYGNTVLDNQVGQDSSFEPDASSDPNVSRESIGMQYEDSTSRRIRPRHIRFHERKNLPFAESSQAAVSDNTTGAPEERETILFRSVQKVETDYKNTVPNLQFGPDSSFEPDASSDLNVSREATGMQYEDSSSHRMRPRHMRFHERKNLPFAEQSQATVSDVTTIAPENIDSIVFSSGRSVETYYDDDSKATSDMKHDSIGPQRVVPQYSSILKTQSIKITQKSKF